jgi:hypothetical protein
VVGDSWKTNSGEQSNLVHSTESKRVIRRLRHVPNGKNDQAAVLLLETPTEKRNNCNSLVLLFACNFERRAGTKWIVRPIASLRRSSTDVVLGTG